MCILVQAWSMGIEMDLAGWKSWMSPGRSLENAVGQAGETRLALNVRPWLDLVDSGKAWMGRVRETYRAIPWRTR